MCGIAGFSGNFSERLLTRMNAAQSHRGPDGAGTHYDEATRTGLAHVRLAILDLSDAGLQPLWSHDGRVGIIFNGEIYNFRELRHDLAARGHRFHTETDTEVLIALYREHGAAMLDKLNGMFAFALWDADKKSLLLARDRYGVKPLYFTRNETGFLFASELRTLLCESSVSRELNRSAIAHQLSYIWAPAPETILRDVYKLEQGCALIVQDGRITRSWRYACLPAEVDDKPQPIGEAVEQLRSLLEQAVARQLVSDVPVGAFLSGGLDSTAIVSYAQKNYTRAERMQCYTLGAQELDKGFVADLPYAIAAAAEMNVPLTTVELDENSALALPDFLARQDEPVADPAALNVYQICSRARADGTKVLLSGAAGDDLFSGYRRHVALGLEKHWNWLPQGARSLVASGARQLPKSHTALRRARKAAEHAHLSADERLISYFYWTAPDRVRALTGSSIDVAEPLREALSELPNGVPQLEKMLYLEKRFFLADHNLNYTDKAAMSVGVEVRVPFLDPDLIDFAARLHPKLKVRRGESKWLFKRAMKGVVPECVLHRPKSGFGGPIAKWLRGPLRPWLMDQLGSASLSTHADRKEIANVLRELDSGADDAAYTLLVLASIAQWQEEIGSYHLSDDAQVQRKAADCGR